MPHHATTASRLLKNCKPALIPSSIAEVRFTFDGKCREEVFVSVKNPISSPKLRMVGWTWKLNTMRFRGDERHPRFIIWEYMTYITIDSWRNEVDGQLWDNESGCRWMVDVCWEHVFKLQPNLIPSSTFVDHYITIYLCDVVTRKYMWYHVVYIWVFP